MVYYLPSFILHHFWKRKMVFWLEAAEMMKKEILCLSRFCSFISLLSHKVGCIYAPAAPS